MGGLLIVALFAIYVWIAIVAIRRAKGARFKTLVTIAVVLIPTADAIYGRIRLGHLCSAEGGLRVFGSAVNVAGIYFSTGPDDRWIKEYGFKFAESRTVENRGVNRLTRQGDGLIVLEKNVEPISAYRLRFVPGDLAEAYMRSTYVVESVDGKSVLGQLVNINYAGGWVERAVGGLYGGRGSAGTCLSNVEVDALRCELVQKTLKHSRTEKPR